MDNIGLCVVYLGLKGLLHKDDEDIVARKLNPWDDGICFLKGSAAGGLPGEGSYYYRSWLGWSLETTTIENTEDLVWEAEKSSPQCPWLPCRNADLILSNIGLIHLIDYYLLPKMKKELSGHHFDNNDEVITAVDYFLKVQDTDFCK